ncbi:Integrase zinc binding domain [Popillia japonica]|uniref:RNA-directed DNA polymerase n=1 Tax=Popillia japonica TaxID=7064 RepID=A0AAW1I9Q4_POPJA
MPKKLTVQEVAKETETDPVLKQVIAAIQNQNANAWEKPDIRQFKNVKDELTLGQSIILRGHRIIIPTSLQQRTIKLAHLGHQGIVKTKQLLRSKVWFPNIDKLTEQEIRKCIACQATDESKYKAPLQLRDVKDELTLGQSIILRGHRIIIPRSLQQRTIKLAHLGHQGIVKTKQLLRSKVWFPNIDKLTEQEIRKCIACQATDESKYKAPLQLRETPRSKVWFPNIDKLTEQEIRKCIACQATDESKYKAPLQLRETPNQPFINLDIDYAGPFQNNKYAVLQYH